MQHLVLLGPGGLDDDTVARLGRRVGSSGDIAEQRMQFQREAQQRREAAREQSASAVPHAAVARAAPPARRQFQAAREGLRRAGRAMNQGFTRAERQSHRFDPRDEAARPIGADDPQGRAPVSAAADTAPRNRGAWRAEADSYLPSMVCPIAMEPFRDPVQAEDGHSYERASIERWVASSKTSPKTGAPMGPLLRPNHSMRSAVEELTAQLEARQAGKE